MIPKAVQSLVWNSRYLEVGLYVVSSSDPVYAVVLCWSDTQFRLMFEQIKTLSKRNFVYEHQTTSFALWRFGIFCTCTVNRNIGEDEILPQLFHFNLIYFNQSVRRHYAWHKLRYDPWVCSKCRVEVWVTLRRLQNICRSQEIPRQSENHRSRQQSLLATEALFNQTTTTTKQTS